MVMAMLAALVKGAGAGGGGSQLGRRESECLFLSFQSDGRVVCVCYLVLLVTV